MWPVLLFEITWKSISLIAVTGNHSREAHPYDALSWLTIFTTAASAQSGRLLRGVERL